MKSTETIEEIISYRTSMRVTECITYDNYSAYPICPKCNCTFEREYQTFCDRCGQKLSWTGYYNAVVKFGKR